LLKNVSWKSKPRETSFTIQPWDEASTTLRLSNGGKTAEAVQPDWSNNCRVRQPKASKGIFAYSMLLEHFTNTGAMFGWAPLGSALSTSSLYDQGACMNMYDGNGVGVGNRQGQGTRSYSSGSIVSTSYNPKTQTVSFYVGAEKHPMSCSGIPGGMVPTLCLYDPKNIFTLVKPPKGIKFT